MVYTAKSDITTDSQFNKRKKITINSSPDGELVNYPILFTILYESEMQIDFDDVRFNESDGSYIPYWIESKIDSSTSEIWIKTNIPASGGKDIYMYYGNVQLTKNDDSSDIFELFDHFEGSSVDTNIWNVYGAPTVTNSEVIVAGIGTYISSKNSYTGGYGVRTKAKVGDDLTGWMWVGFETTPGGSADINCTTAFSRSDTVTYFVAISGNETIATIHDYIELTDEDYHIASAMRTGTVDKFKLDGGSWITGDYPTNIARYLDINGYNSSLVVDWVLIRKYTLNEPITEIGIEGEEAQHKHGKIIQYIQSGIKTIDTILELPPDSEPGDFYYVAKNGSDYNPGTEALPWLTISHAAASVTTGGTIYVKEGTYTEYVRILNSGLPTNYLIFQPYPGHTVTLDGFGADSHGLYFPGLFDARNVSYFKIIGFQLFNGDCGIRILLSHHLVIKDNFVKDVEYGGIQFGYSQWSYNVVVDGNTVTNTNPLKSYHAEQISLSCVYNFEVKNNYVTQNNNGEGINHKDGTHSGTTHNNIVENCSAVGIYVDSYSSPVYDIEIYNNIMSYNGFEKGDGGIQLCSERGELVSYINVHDNVSFSNYYGFVMSSYSEPGYSSNFADITFTDNNACNNYIEYAGFWGNPPITRLTFTGNRICGVLL